MHHPGARHAAGRARAARSRRWSRWSRNPDGSPNNAAYFWLTGALSSFLDNAPTYLVFFELAGGDAQAADDAGRADAGRDLVRRGVHGREHLHRQRAQLHGLRHRAQRAASRCRASSATCCGPGAVLIPVFILATLVFFR